MTIVNAVLENNPPPAVALTFLPGLPPSDRIPDTYSFAFPLGYFPNVSVNPQESVIAPTVPAEIFNYAGLLEQDIPFASGYAAYDNLNRADLLLPDYTGQYPKAGTNESIALNYAKRRNYDTDQISFIKYTVPITVDNIQSDSAASWLITVKNGYLYQDFVVTQEELDYTDAPPSGHLPTEGYSGSWLKAAGFKSGDYIRLFYTVPSQSVWFNYTEAGQKSISDVKEITRVVNAEAIHETDGNIILDSANIFSVERLSEISSEGEKVIFDHMFITGTVTDTTNTLNVLQFNGKKGTLKILPAPTEGASLKVTYTKEEFNVEYRGFYDDISGLWQGLDLNPTEGHIYNTGIDRGIRVNASSQDLIYRSIAIYLLPVAALKLDSLGNPSYPLQYYSAYVQGGKKGTWSPLRHYVTPLPRGSSADTTTQAEIASWGYALFDQSVYAQPQYFSASQKGIPLNQDSAILIGKIKVRPRTRTEIKDARRFSGLPGSYDRKSYTNHDIDPRTRRWDTSPWEGLSAPLAGSVLVEVDPSVITSQGIETIEAAVKESMPPGILPIILPKKLKK